MYFDHIIPFSHIIYIGIRWVGVFKKKEEIVCVCPVFRSEDSLEELLLFFYHVSPKGRTLSSGLGVGASAL